MNNYVTSDLLLPSLHNLQKGRCGESSINGTTDLWVIVKEGTKVDMTSRLAAGPLVITA